jgi:hypothetical protein
MFNILINLSFNSDAWLKRVGKFSNVKGSTAEVSITALVGRPLLLHLALLL